jgi:hypothetical protein
VNEPRFSERETSRSPAVNRSRTGARRVARAARPVAFRRR